MTATFPQKLYEIVESADQAVLSWTSDGTAFKIHDSRRFTEETMAKYFRHSKIASFQRQLNLYGFRRVTQGEDAGAYSHPLFQRNKPELVEGIMRPHVKATSNKSEVVYSSEVRSTSVSATTTFYSNEECVDVIQPRKKNHDHYQPENVMKILNDPHRPINPFKSSMSPLLRNLLGDSNSLVDSSNLELDGAVLDSLGNDKSEKELLDMLKEDDGNKICNKLDSKRQRIDNEYRIMDDKTASDGPKNGIGYLSRNLKRFDS